MGTQAATTSGSAAARAAISGPMPEGSPTVSATRGSDPRAAAVESAAITSTAPALARATAPMPATGRIVAAPFVTAAGVRLTAGVRQLVPETALQAAAQARELRGIEAQILLLRHLDR